MIKWLLIQLFYWTCVYLIAVPLYPFLYPFQKRIKKGNPLWYLLHDNPFGPPWYWTKFGIPLAGKGEKQQRPKGLKKFWISYNYSVFRNGCWRMFDTILKQEQGEKTDIKIIHNDSYDGKNLSAFTVLRMKFKSNGIESDNVGNEFDLDKTYQGKNFVKYKVNGKRYFLYSYCKVDGNKGVEFTYGWNGLRPLIRRKIKRLK